MDNEKEEEEYEEDYEVEEVKKLEYVDTIKEITNYLKSKDFKFFKKYLIESEAKEYEQLKKEAKVKLVKKKNSEEAIGISHCTNIPAFSTMTTRKNQPLRRIRVGRVVITIKYASRVKAHYPRSFSVLEME